MELGKIINGKAIAAEVRMAAASEFKTITAAIPGFRPSICIIQVLLNSDKWLTSIASSYMYWWQNIIHYVHCTFNSVDVSNVSYLGVQ